MKDVLDLLEEFCKINEDRIQSRGKLPSRSEVRWKELKTLYDRLMARTAAEPGTDKPRYVMEDIRQRLRHRERLRIPARMDIFFRYQDTYLPSRLVNLSRGGLFLSSKLLLTKGSRIVVYLPNLCEEYGDLFETGGEIAWSTKGNPDSGLPRGMGVRFTGLSRAAEAQLDTYLIRALRKRL